MELFSKRNSDRSLRRLSWRYSTVDRKPGEFLSDSLRNRLREETRYIISSNEYLEPFLLVKNERTGEIYLHSKTLSDLSLREIGYDIADVFDLTGLEFKIDQQNDLKFFDLIEVLLIFTKIEKRPDFISRLGNIFQEEGGAFSIHGFMIVNQDNGGLQSLIPLLKEKNLRVKIGEYYQQRIVPTLNWEFLARLSADIVQLIFSSPQSRTDTKKHASDLCTKVASKWTDKSRVKDLTQLLSETVKNAKALSNQIENVRHTDRMTIPVESPNFYKLIALENINITELVILSLPELFISTQDPEEMKSAYLAKYALKKDRGWIVKAEEQGEPIDPEDIPF